MKQILIILLACVILMSCAINLCNANEIKETKLETSVGTFIIKGKIAKEGGTPILKSYPEYYIIVTKGNNKINFYANGTYFPRDIQQDMNKAWSGEEISIGIFINFLTRAYKAATLNYDDFYKKYYQEYGKGFEIESEMGLHKDESFQERCKKTYEGYQLNLNKIKVLLGNTPEFPSKLNALYNDSLKIRKKMKIYLRPL
ncbi:MAG: hypothetical protein HQ579_08255 [Candidatus Omnitrophica bacterium]|nr:hypothetical protein [Candidatus Omnitrophota bacterium]